MTLTGSQVARLFGRSRGWGWMHVRAGDFGVPRRVGHVWFVDLSAVEKYAGRSFSQSQIRAAQLSARHFDEHFSEAQDRNHD